ncbi:hypothetical protein PIB30_071890 [Stylosanthes scabra]|uniref:Uncharacterized protein n=1 Tax=Stylosanthes scabra TaxID=79078 RepID=A0ABU6YQQ3_9FABA|nr:hypothetical protein [Stylosanthes scabra]
MGSGVIYYEYEKREKFEDYDMNADAELGIFKIRRYHFDDESFVHPLHSVRFNPDCLYEIPIEALMADEILSASMDEKSPTERPRSSRRPSPHYSPRTMPEIGGMEPSVEKGESSEEDPEMEEEDAEKAGSPEDRVPATPSLPMDIDAEENFQRYIEELGRAPEPSPLRSS